MEKSALYAKLGEETFNELLQCGFQWWNYNEQGSDWGYAGQRQSPVDIVKAETEQIDMGTQTQVKLEVNYSALI